MHFSHGKTVLFLYLYVMTDRELVVFLQQQNAILIATLKSLSQTVQEQARELAALKAVLLEKDKDTERLKRLSNINFPKKTEKRKRVVSSAAKDKPSAPTPKERGNNGAKRKVYDNIQEVVEDVLPSDANFDEKLAV